MKSLNKIFLYCLVAIGSIALLTACEKDNDTGTPIIKYVRITSPQSSDSLLAGAGQGQLIAIMGDNLQETVEAWFNDQKAMLTSTYITKSSILVSVPSQIPMSVNNKIKLVFKNGGSLLYDFEVQISKPVINSMLCEFVNAGDVAVIRGDYFYAPLTVTFPGGGTGEIVSVDDKQIEVKVPAGATAGQIIVKTNFGETKSNFSFRDPRNHFIDSDPYEGWWNSSYVVSSPGAGDPALISGNYIRFKKDIGAWSWNELAGGPASSMPQHSKNIPADAILNPADYNFKFEFNTIKPYNASTIRFNMALNSEQNDNYLWQPPYDTKGKWQTVVIPFEEIVASYNPKPTVNPDGYWCRLLIQGPTALDADLCFDNLRVVPKVIK